MTIGSAECAIVSVTSSELTCSAPAQTDISSTELGPRGLLYQLWDSTEDATVTDTSAADYHSTVLDGAAVEGPLFNETNGFTARLSGLFLAPYTGAGQYLNSRYSTFLFR